MLFEAEVHSSLLAFLREQGKLSWPHHLTMARLVARALRLGRPALIQTGSAMVRYCLSYLTPALLGHWPVLLVAPASVQQRLLQVEIPQLQQWLKTNKEIRRGDRWPEEDSFGGLMLTSPNSWLADRLEDQGRFPRNIPTLIEQADDLQEWTRGQLTASIQHWDWDGLMQRYPHQAELIRDVRVQLIKAVFNHPKNPYECCLIEKSEQESLQSLFRILAAESLLDSAVRKFWHRWQTGGQMIWASIARETGQFTLHIAPVEIATVLSKVWLQQPVVLIGGFLDWEKNAPIYRQQLGLGDILCLKFSPNRQSEHIQLYLPDRLPMPNTPQFQGVLMQQVRTLVSLSSNVKKPVVLLVEDVPLKAQVGTTMAAEFGSRVGVEKINLAENGILVSGWEFWRVHQDKFPTPQLLVIATLPLPSLENPLVAGRVAYYKRQHQDWFGLYLLPTALREIQRAVMPLRESQGVVALLDNRVNHRSYGSRILSALEPCARINYIDPSWFGLAP
ncbi:MAG: helicase C-terminal domain-containing protein [Xenococcaceae cyanobacterium]